jgi:voltage-gated potassium channel
MSQQTTSPRQHGNAYNIFILGLTLFSLVIMVVMFFPLNDATIHLLQIYDLVICLIFLIDFLINFFVASKKTDYFIKERGWLDLLGSIPAFVLPSRYISFLRLARLNRFIYISHQIRGSRRGELLRDLIKNRSQYAGFITILVTIIILSSTSVLVLEFENQSPDANIKSGWDAFWYSVVTITTVGYGDRFPITTAGRIAGMFTMFIGVGIIGALASILSSILVGSRSASSENEEQNTIMMAKIEQELTTIKNEITEIRQKVDKIVPES